MMRIRALAVAAALVFVVPLTGCASGGADQGDHSAGPDDSGDGQGSGEDAGDADSGAGADADADATLPNDDPRCKLWSSPLIMLTLILHPVADVDHFPPAALDATCRWEVAAGTNTIKYPHTYEALWLDAGDATFDQVTAAFEADGATVAVDETGGPGAAYGWLTYATISSPDGTGELSMRAADHDFSSPYITFQWTRA